jgi:hypothetical protein
VSAAATTEVNASQVPIKRSQSEPRDHREKSLRSSSVVPRSGRASSSLGEEEADFSEGILRVLSTGVKEVILPRIDD